MLTVITPTYNRADCLMNLYDSLLRQNSREFEWIVIDDGSTDDTEERMKRLQEQESGFSILYKRQENGGKHRAVNAGVSLAKGDFVFIVDSDDLVAEGAIEKIEKWTKEIGNAENFAGVSGTKSRMTGEILGEYPKGIPFVDATNLQRIPKKLKGDKAEIYRTSLLKKYPFPEIAGETFLPESVVWDEIAHDGYQIRWYPDILIITEYREDGLTKNINRTVRENFKGYTLAKQKIFHYYPFPYNFVGLASYMETAKELGIKDKEIRSAMELSVMEQIFGKCFYILWKFLKKAG